MRYLAMFAFLLLPLGVARSAIIDNNTSGYSESGAGWGSFNNPSGSGYGANYRFNDAGGGASALWSFGAQSAGSYRITTRYWAQSNRATNARFRVYVAGAVVVDMTINQELAPGSILYDGLPWQDIAASITVTEGQTVSVMLSDDADEFVIADAVRIDLLPEPEEPPPGGGGGVSEELLASLQELESWAHLESLAVCFIVGLALLRVFLLGKVSRGLFGSMVVLSATATADADSLYITDYDSMSITQLEMASEGASSWEALEIGAGGGGGSHYVPTFELSDANPFFRINGDDAMIFRAGPLVPEVDVLLFVTISGGEVVDKYWSEGMGSPTTLTDFPGWVETPIVAVVQTAEEVIERVLHFVGLRTLGLCFLVGLGVLLTFMAGNRSRHLFVLLISFGFLFANNADAASATVNHGVYTSPSFIASKIYNKAVADGAAVSASVPGSMNLPLYHVGGSYYGVYETTLFPAEGSEYIPFKVYLRIRVVEGEVKVKLWGDGWSYEEAEFTRRIATGGQMRLFAPQPADATITEAEVFLNNDVFEMMGLGLGGTSTGEGGTTGGGDFDPVAEAGDPDAKEESFGNLLKAKVPGVTIGNEAIPNINLTFGTDVKSFNYMLDLEPTNTQLINMRTLARVIVLFFFAWFLTNKVLTVVRQW